MAKTEFDYIDGALLVAGFIGITAMVGIASWNLMDITLSDVLFSLGGTDITYAFGLSAGAFIGTVATNDNTSLADLRDDVESLDDDHYLYAVAICVGGFVGWLFFPGFVDFVTSSDVVGLAYVGVCMFAQGVVGWML